MAPKVPPPDDHPGRLRPWTSRALPPCGRWLAALFLVAVTVARGLAQDGGTPTKLDQSTATALAALPDADRAAAPPEPTPLPARSSVFVAHDDNAVDARFHVNPGRVRAMVDRLILAAAGGQGNAEHAWRSLGVGPADVVGIKIAAAGGAAAPARRAVVEAVVESLLAAGHPRDRIVVWDRDADDLRAAGFLPPRTGGRGASTAGGEGGVFNLCPVAAIAPREGYDPTAIYTAPMLGKLIWGDLSFRGLAPQVLVDSPKTAANTAPPEDPLRPVKRAPRPNTGPVGPSENLSEQSHWCTLLTRRITKIVNIPTMSDSVFCGLAGALYNVSVPNIDNWRRFTGEPRFGNPYVADLYAAPPLRGKIVLNLCDGLLAQFAGGPQFQPFYSFRPATLLASRDPVALDAVALRTLAPLRAGRGLPDLAKVAGHVHSAAELGLGHDAPDLIDLHNVAP